MESNIGTKETLKEGYEIATNIVPLLLARQRPLKQKETKTKYCHNKNQRIKIRRPNIFVF
jgi:hypothetical protein